MAGDKDSHSRPSQALAGWRFASGYTGFYGSAGRGVFSWKQEAAENCRKPPDGLGRGGSGRGRGTALPRVSGETGGAWAGPSPPERLAGLCTAPPGSPPRPLLRGPPAKGTVPGMAIPPTPWARQDSPGPHQGRERGGAGQGAARSPVCCRCEGDQSRGHTSCPGRLPSRPPLQPLCPVETLSFWN